MNKYAVAGICILFVCVCCSSIVVFVVIRLGTKAASNDFLTHLETFIYPQNASAATWKVFVCFLFFCFLFFFIENSHNIQSIEISLSI